MQPGPATDDEPRGGNGAPASRFIRDDDGNLVYVDVLGSASNHDFRVTDDYCLPRDNGTTMHTGIDLAPGEPGSPDTNALALSPTGGKVTQIGAVGFGPNSVTIQAPNGMYWTYGHLDYDSVKVGDAAAGDPLGVIGTKGNSTGIHLHIQASTGSA